MHRWSYIHPWRRSEPACEFPELRAISRARCTALAVVRFGCSFRLRFGKWIVLRRGRLTGFPFGGLLVAEFETPGLDGEESFRIGCEDCEVFCCASAFAAASDCAMGNGLLVEELSCGDVEPVFAEPCACPVFDWPDGVCPEVGLLGCC